MKAGWPLLVLGLAGCSLVFPLEDKVVVEPPDAAPDADPALCYASPLVSLCLTVRSDEPLSIPAGSTVDVDTDASCQVYTGDDPDAWCVVAASSMLISGTLRAHGARPLVLVSVGEITVDGLLDVSSATKAGFIGAGANPLEECVPKPATGMAGGHGGSFVGTGGAGGRAGTVRQGATTADRLRGGCRGAGGSFDGGSGGIGGGAVFALAGGAITITGTVNASGAGGHGGDAINSGGGGGGAGGMIGFAGDLVTIGPTGKVFANGGGGGEGGGNPTDGMDGADPAMPAIPALGGTGAVMNGGPGGKGSALDTIDGEAGGIEGNGGGGGGGGGAGAIKFDPPAAIAGVVSPLPS